MKISVFPDTNIFLHYQSLDQIDLPDLLNSDEVELMIAPAIIDELDRHKWDHPVPKLRERAQEAAGRLDSWILEGQPIRPGVSVSLHFARPQDATIRSNHLSARSNDDLLFATVLEYTANNPNQDTIVLTADTGVRLRANSLGLSVQALPDEYLLPPAKDEAQKEIQRLQREVLELRNRLPSLDLSFAGGNDQLEVVLEPQASTLPRSMRDLLNRVKDDMRREIEHNLERERDDTNLTGVRSPNVDEFPEMLNAISSFEEPSEEEVERYLQEVKAYPDAFETYLKKKFAIENEHRRTVRLDLTVENTGHQLAEDILLTLELPDHLTWREQPTEHELPEYPRLPTPPRTRMQLLFEERGYAPFLAPLNDFNMAFAVDDSDSVFGPVISNSGQVLEWEVGECRQQLGLRLEPLYVMFIEANKITNFPIEYTIHERNIPQPLKGRLLVIIQQRERPEIGGEETAQPSSEDEEQ